MNFPTQQRQQAYDPMARMMQLLQLVMQQNQQGQQQQNQDRNFGLEQQQLDMRGQQFDQQFAAQKAEQEQRQQQAIMAALSRSMPQKEMGFDPSALYHYLQQMGVQIPGMETQQPASVDPQKAAAMAMMQQLGQ